MYSLPGPLSLPQSWPRLPAPKDAVNTYRAPAAYLPCPGFWVGVGTVLGR